MIYATSRLPDVESVELDEREVEIDLGASKLAFSLGLYGRRQPRGDVWPPASPRRDPGGTSLDVRQWRPRDG